MRKGRSVNHPLTWRSCPRGTERSAHTWQCRAPHSGVPLQRKKGEVCMARLQDYPAIWIVERCLFAVAAGLECVLRIKHGSRNQGRGPFDPRVGWCAALTLRHRSQQARQRRGPHRCCASVGARGAAEDLECAGGADKSVGRSDKSSGGQDAHYEHEGL
jgi:hypothetical protein